MFKALETSRHDSNVTIKVVGSDAEYRVTEKGLLRLKDRALVTLMDLTPEHFYQDWEVVVPKSWLDIEIERQESVGMLATTRQESQMFRDGYADGVKSCIAEAAQRIQKMMYPSDYADNDYGLSGINTGLDAAIDILKEMIGEK